MGSGRQGSPQAIPNINLKSSFLLSSDISCFVDMVVVVVVVLRGGRSRKDGGGYGLNGCGDARKKNKKNRKKKEEKKKGRESDIPRTTKHQQPNTHNQKQLSKQRQQQPRSFALPTLKRKEFCRIKVLWGYGMWPPFPIMERFSFFVLWRLCFICISHTKTKRKTKRT